MFSERLIHVDRNMKNTSGLCFDKQLILKVKLLFIPAFWLKSWTTVCGIVTHIVFGEDINFHLTLLIVTQRNWTCKHNDRVKRRGFCAKSSPCHLRANLNLLLRVCTDLKCITLFDIYIQPGFFIVSPDLNK